MKKIFETSFKYMVLGSIGGFIYIMLELMWRGYTHWTSYVMGFVGFLFMGLINEIFTFETPLVWQIVISTSFITIMELTAGLIFNSDYSIWDYRNVPFNFRGQICLPYSMLWCGLSLFGIWLDDWIRYLLFDEERPHYKWL